MVAQRAPASLPLKLDRAATVELRLESSDLGLNTVIVLPAASGSERASFSKLLTVLSAAGIFGKYYDVSREADLKRYESDVQRRDAQRKEQQEFYTQVRACFSDMVETMATMKRDYYREIDSLREQLSRRDNDPNFEPDLSVFFFDPSSYRLPSWEEILEKLDDMRMKRELLHEELGGDKIRKVPMHMLCKSCRGRFQSPMDFSASGKLIGEEHKEQAVQTDGVSSGCQSLEDQQDAWQTSAATHPTSSDGTLNGGADSAGDALPYSRADVSGRRSLNQLQDAAEDAAFDAKCASPSQQRDAQHGGQGRHDGSTTRTDICPSPLNIEFGISPSGSRRGVASDLDYAVHPLDAERLRKELLSPSGASVARSLATQNHGITVAGGCLSPATHGGDAEGGQRRSSGAQFGIGVDGDMGTTSAGVSVGAAGAAEHVIAESTANAAGEEPTSVEATKKRPLTQEQIEERAQLLGSRLERLFAKDPKNQRRRAFNMWRQKQMTPKELAARRLARQLEAFHRHLKRIAIGRLVQHGVAASSSSKEAFYGGSQRPIPTLQGKAPLRQAQVAGPTILEQSAMEKTLEHRPPSRLARIPRRGSGLQCSPNVKTQGRCTMRRALTTISMSPQVWCRDPSADGAMSLNASTGAGQSAATGVVAEQIHGSRGLFASDTSDGIDDRPASSSGRRNSSASGRPLSRQQRNPPGEFEFGIVGRRASFGKSTSLPQLVSPRCAMRPTTKTALIQ